MADTLEVTYFAEIKKPIIDNKTHELKLKDYIKQAKYINELIHQYNINYFKKFENMSMADIYILEIKKFLESDWKNDFQIVSSYGKLSGTKCNELIDICKQIENIEISLIKILHNKTEIKEQTQQLLELVEQKNTIEKFFSDGVAQKTPMAIKYRNILPKYLDKISKQMTEITNHKACKNQYVEIPKFIESLHDITIHYYAIVNKSLTDEICTEIFDLMNETFELNESIKKFVQFVNSMKNVRWIQNDTGTIIKPL